MTDPVRQLPGRDEKRGEHDRVGVQHPGRAATGSTSAKVCADVGEGDVEDRRVEERRERGERRDGQRAAGVDEHDALSPAS